MPYLSLNKPGTGHRLWLSALLLGGLLLAWRIWAIHLSGITLYVDEAQYWGWAQALDWGYFSKPPGVAVLIAASTALFGDGIIGTKLLAMACYPLTAWVALLIAREAYDEQTAIASGLAVLTLPIYAWLGLFVSTDAPLVLLWAAAILLYIRALTRGGTGNWLLLGIICGLGLLTKYTMLAWLGSAMLHLLIVERRRLLQPAPWLAAMLACAFLLPNLIWNAGHDFPTLRHTADITLQRTAGGLLPLLTFLGAQWLAFGPLLGTAFAPALLPQPASDNQRRLRGILICFALPLWLVAAAQAAGGSANANWAAPAFVPASILAVAWLLGRGHRRWLFIALSLNLLLTATLYHWPTLSASFFPQVATPYSRALGWDKVGQQLRPIAAAHPGTPLLAEERTLLAHLQYELRDQPLRVASWNPKGTRNDHYQLTASFTRGDALILVPDNVPDHIASRFAATRHLATLEADTGPRRKLHFQVYLLHDFQGY